MNAEIRELLLSVYGYCATFLEEIGRFREGRESVFDNEKECRTITTHLKAMVAREQKSTKTAVCHWEMLAVLEHHMRLFIKFYTKISTCQR